MTITPAPPGTTPSTPPVHRPPGATTGPKPAGSAGHAARTILPPIVVDPVRVIRQYLWWIIAGIFVGAAVGVVANYAWAWTYPIYTATTTWQVNPPQLNPGDVNNAAQLGSDQLQRKISTVAQSITSVDILRGALSSPTVANTEWIRSFQDANGGLSVDDALRDLQKHVRATPIGDTMLVQVRISGGRISDLKAILTAINAEYSNSLNQSKNAMTSQVGTSLDNEKTSLTRQIAAIDQEIQTRLNTVQVPLNPNSGPNDLTLQLQQAISDQSEGQKNYDLAESLVKSYQERLKQQTLTFTDDEIASARMDPNMQRQQAQVVSLQTSVNAARQRFGESHPYVKTLEKSLSAANAVYDSELHDTLNTNFKSTLQLAQNQMQNLKGTLTDLNAKINDLRGKIVDIDKQRNWVISRREDRDALQQRINDIDNQMKDVQLTVNQQRMVDATLKGAPYADTIPTMPKLFIMVPLGILVIGGLTLGFVFLKELTDRRVKGPGDVGVIPHSRILGLIPHLDEDPAHPRRMEMILADGPNGAVSESIRQLQGPIVRRLNEGGYRSLLVVGVQPAAGATGILSNLAITFAHAERSVLLIDANLRRPQVARVFGVPDGQGLGDVLAGDAAVDRVIRQTGVPGVSVLTAGTPASQIVERLSGDRFGSLLRQAELSYDLILVDCPAAVAVGDWLVLANQVDATMLIVRAMEDERGLVARIVQQIHEARAEYIGLVLNGVRSSAGGYMKRNLQKMNEYQQIRG